MLISTSNWFKLQPKQLVRFLFFDFLAFTFALKHLLSAKLAWQKHGAFSCPFSRQVHHPLQIVMPKWFIDVFCLLAWFFPPAFWLRVFFLWRGSTHDEKNHLRVNIRSPSDCSAYGYRDWSHEMLVYNIEHHEWKKSPCTINCTKNLFAPAPCWPFSYRLPHGITSCSPLTPIRQIRLFWTLRHDLAMIHHCCWISTFNGFFAQFMSNDWDI